MRIWHSFYTEIITLERVFEAWEEFSKGKRGKADVALFERNLEDNLFTLYELLKNKTYKHGAYKAFYIRDPKIRHIHKAYVQDRVVHHLTSKVLERIFEPTFCAHSYSCRKNKGTHKGIKTFIKLARKVSKNNTSPLYVLKCDIKKFFASVDHTVLLEILNKSIKDNDFIWLLNEIILSFKTEGEAKGMPIGNLTSQLFANIYMNPLDQYMKHVLKTEYYIRYADDFVVLSQDKKYLENLIPVIKVFLEKELKLTLHPNKVEIRNYYLGVDFLGYIIFPNFVIPRTKTKRRMFRKIYKQIAVYRKGQQTYESLNQTIQSYLGYLSHANTYKLSQDLKNQILFQLTN
jgi:retron-type reverse transcriptase